MVADELSDRTALLSADRRSVGPVGPVIGAVTSERKPDPPLGRRWHVGFVPSTSNMRSAQPRARLSRGSVAPAPVRGPAVVLPGKGTGTGFHLLGTDEVYDRDGVLTDAGERPQFTARGSRKLRLSNLIDGAALLEPNINPDPRGEFVIRCRGVDFDGHVTPLYDNHTNRSLVPARGAPSPP